MPLLITVAAHAPTLAIIFAEDPERDMALDLDRLMQGGGLSPAQARVALLAKEGLSTGEIAGRIGISENTARTHLRRAFAKLDCRDRRELAIRLIALGATSR